MNGRRQIKTFEADEDVARMLGAASAEGVKLVFLCNEALRRFLTQKGYAKKKIKNNEAA